VFLEALHTQQFPALWRGNLKKDFCPAFGTDTLVGSLTE
jgi:hypothetical protein